MSEATTVYQVDELIEELEQYPDDYQVRVNADGVEVPPLVKKKDSETVIL